MKRTYVCLDQSKLILAGTLPIKDQLVCMIQSHMKKKPEEQRHYSGIVSRDMKTVFTLVIIRGHHRDGARFVMLLVIPHKIANSIKMKNMVNIKVIFSTMILSFIEKSITSMFILSLLNLA